MKPEQYHQQWQRQIRRSRQQADRIQRERRRGVWYGLGVFGMVGWSVTLPMLLGIALGWALDLRFSGRVSWTLTFLILGLVAGVLNAWYWVQRERRTIEREFEHEREYEHD
jgi:ATP synthase protein I